MTSAAPEVDPLLAYEKRPSVSFDVARGGYAVKQVAKLVVQDWPKMVDDRNSDTKEVQFWPLRPGETEPKAKQKLVVNVLDAFQPEDEQERTLWAKPVRKGKSLFAALMQATVDVQKATGDRSYRIKPGDTLEIVYLGDDTSVPAKMGNHPKMFACRITVGTYVEPPAADPFAGGGSTDASPWADEPAKPVAPTSTPRPSGADNPFGDAPAGEDEPPF